MGSLCGTLVPFRGSSSVPGASAALVKLDSPSKGDAV